MNTLKRPALMIIDMQNDFVRRGAPLEVESARMILPALTHLLARFRAARLPVIHTRYVATPNYQHLSDRLKWLRLTEAPLNACRPGFQRIYEDCEGARDAAGVIDELSPAEGEIVIDKPYYSAFFGTDLNQRLIEAEVDGLFVAGTLTEMCVEDTARHAVHHGYRTALVSDSVASNDPELHQITLRAFERNYGDVLSSDQIEKCISKIAGLPVVA